MRMSDATRGGVQGAGWTRRGGCTRRTVRCLHATTVICQQAETVRGCLSDAQCVCVLRPCVSLHAWELWVGVTPWGGTILTHLPATIAASMSRKRAAKKREKSVNCEALTTGSYGSDAPSTDHLKDALLRWWNVSHHGNRREEKGMWYVFYSGKGDYSLRGLCWIRCRSLYFHLWSIAGLYGKSLNTDVNVKGFICQCVTDTLTSFLASLWAQRGLHIFAAASPQSGVGGAVKLV